MTSHIEVQMVTRNMSDCIALYHQMNQVPYMINEWNANYATDDETWVL